MNVYDEISAIRADLNGVKRTVERLSLRLDEAEARQRALDAAPRESAPPSPIEVLRPDQAEPVPPTVVETIRTPSAPLPPPLPLERAKPAPAPTPATVATVAAAPVASRPATPAALPAKKPRRFGPPEGMSWEMALGTYWLPRIGVPLIAMAVVYGFTWVAGQFQDAPWMPWARVAVGLGIAGAMAGTGWKLEARYPAFARLLMGGGLGVLYFVIFATWYIPQTRIAPRQEYTLVALALLVAGWGAIAHWRRSALVALIMTLMGHFTVALSTLTLEAPSRAAVGGLLLLGAGSAWFLYRHGWYAVAMAAMTGSYLNQFFWLASAPSGGQAPEFIAGMLVLCAYLVLYAIADRVAPVAFAVERARLRTAYAGVNTGGFLLLSLILMQGFEFTRSTEHLLYFGTALFALAMGWSYTRRDWSQGRAETGDRPAEDPLASFYLTKASVLTAVGFGAWLDGPTVTLSLALQSLVLILAARETHRHAPRLLALGAVALTLAHGACTWGFSSAPSLGEPGFVGHSAVLAAAVAVLWGVAEIYRVTPWHSFATGPWRGPLWLQTLREDLEIHEHAAAVPGPSRMVLSHIVAFAGVLLLLGHGNRLLADHQAAPLFALIAAALAGLGLGLRSAPLLLASAAVTFEGALTWFGHLATPAASASDVLYPGAIVIVSALAIAELLRVLAPVRMARYALHGDIQGSWPRNSELVANLHAMLAALLTAATALDAAMPPAHGLLVLGALSLAAVAGAALAGSASLGLFALVTGCFCAAPAVLLPSGDGMPWAALAGVGALAVASTAVETRWWGERAGLAFHRLLPAPYLVYGVVTWCVLWILDGEIGPGWRPAAIMVVALVLMAGMLALHARSLAVLATAVAALATLDWLADRPATAGWPVSWYAGAALLVGGALAGERFLRSRKPFAEPWPARILVVCAWLAALGFNREFADPAWRFAGAGVVALAFLGWSAVFRGGSAALLSLAGAALYTLLILAESAPAVVEGESGRLYGYLILIAYWLCVERGTAALRARATIPLLERNTAWAIPAVVGLSVLLGVVCLSRIPVIHNFYLTMSWAAWAIAVFGWAMFTGQRWFRYAGLAVIGLALGRVFLLDVWRLHGLERAGALLALGVTILGVGYGYTRWRASQESSAKPGNGEEGN
ncbi:MAG: DUF2339 domain-containing protein [Candidatus Hydrogenedentes bacterium]|nr:DUF2339 domain-containing protein [Candidatus Hydrogenedentota bacterium]